MTDDALPASAAADVDAIAAALARLRGRPHGPGGWPGRGSRDERWSHDHDRDPQQNHDHDHNHDHDRRPGFDPRPGFGPGPGAAGGPAARMAGLARMRLLDALAGASHALSVSEVGEAIGVDQPRASRLIQQSVDLGLVRREADPDDARRTRVALTDEGTSLVRGFRGQRRAHLGAALADFTEAERSELARLLTKLAASWTPRA